MASFMIFPMTFPTTSLTTTNATPSAAQSITTIINGSLIDSLSSQDRGLQYGDGFFTTLLVTGEQLLNWSGHWRRIENSARRLQFPPQNQHALFEQIKQAVAVFNVTKSRVETNKVVKLILTRGKGGRGYQMPDAPNISVILQVSLAPIGIEEMTCEAGSSVRWFAFPKPIELAVCETLCGIQPQLAGLKHLNRLENVLARTEITTKNKQEGVMLNAYQQVIGGTQSNLFLLKGRYLTTPQLTDSGVEGTTRHQLSLLAETLGLRWQESIVTLDDLLHADEIFMANAVRGIMPVGQFGQQFYPSVQTFTLHQAWSNWQAANAVSLSLGAETDAVTDATSPVKRSR